MDIVSPVLDILTRLWDCTAKRGAYICGFENNLQALRDDILELRTLRDEVLRRVEREERQDCYLRRRVQVSIWVLQTEKFLQELNTTLMRGDDEAKKKRLVFSCYRYKLGKQITKDKARTFGFTKKGQFDVVTEPLPRPAVDEIPLEKTVALDSIFRQLWSCFQNPGDQSTEIIGLYGTGSVGKTTLLETLDSSIRNKIRMDFNVVIWVAVSKEVNLWKIQEEIREKLEIEDGMWKSKVNEHERAAEIFKILRQKKFVLLLDDLWEPINLSAIGVPIDNPDGSRVVFTARKEEVCHQMNSHKRFRVSTKASLDIFGPLWSCFQNPGDPITEIIGLYGMGGVGKTTLLKKLNNNFLHERRSDFDVVIWVVVSKEVNLWKIQEVIREKLEIGDGMWKNKINEHERAVEIFKILRQKKFMLLLDDLWEPINLSAIGVPVDNANRSTVVFTTRKEEVCGHMKAHKRFRVECLSTEASLDLFRLKVGEDVLNSHHEIPKLAEIVVQECKGLPLALVTVGGAMANWRTPEEWEREIKVLQNYPFEIAGMDDLVFGKLRYSYDRLSDDTLKNCFLYCSLFPEDHNIMKDELIELWIGEGFFDKFDNIYDARNHGEYIVGRLKLASLLETGEYKNIMKMHDVHRDMALKLASEKKNEVLVLECHGLIKPLKISKWKDVKRISLWGPEITFFIDETPSCPDLLTFLVKNTKLKRFPNSFFQCMNALNVLDLSYNKDLTELPGSIGCLINLHHLNLSYTNLRVLPTEVKNLTQLRMLLLDDTKNLEPIPTGVILSLRSLEVFSRLLPTTFPASHSDQSFSDIALLQELECLENISDISLTLYTYGSVVKFKASSKLQCCIKRLTIMCSELETLDLSSSTIKRMEHLDALIIRDCYSLTELNISFEDQGRMQDSVTDFFRNLHYVHIENCPIKDLTWLIYAPSLRRLWVDNCPSLKEMISDDFGSSEIEENVDILSKLESITLISLPSLKSICRRAMLLPSLKDIQVTNCPNLRKLPFNTESAKNSLNTIKGSRTWWEQLEWEDEAAKHAFDSKFFDSDLVLFKTTTPSDYMKQLQRFK